METPKPIKTSAELAMERTEHIHELGTDAMHEMFENKEPSILERVKEKIDNTQDNVSTFMRNTWSLARSFIEPKSRLILPGVNNVSNRVATSPAIEVPQPTRGEEKETKIEIPNEEIPDGKYKEVLTAGKQRFLDIKGRVNALGDHQIGKIQNYLEKRKFRREAIEHAKENVKEAKEALRGAKDHLRVAYAL